MPWGSAAGLLLGTLVVAILTSALGASVMADWDWRVPFIIGGVLAPVGYLIRKPAGETPAYQRAVSDTPIMAAHSATPSQNLYVGIFKAFMFDMLWAVGFYFFLSYMPTFAQRQLSFNAADVFWVSTAGTAFHMLTIPLCGWLSDRFGRKPIILSSCVGFAILLVPAFVLLTGSPTITNLVLVTFGGAPLLSLYSGPAPAAISELFPSKTRAKGLTIGYNLSTLVFGGFTPFLATWLISHFGSPLAPIYYLMVISIAAAIFVLTLREIAKDSLE